MVKVKMFIGALFAVTLLTYTYTLNRVLDESWVWWQLLVVLAVTFASETIYIPVKHHKTDEELDFFDVVVVSLLLVFPSPPVLLGALTGLVLRELIFRTDLKKGLFNISIHGLILTIYTLAVSMLDPFSYTWGAVFILTAVFFFASMLNLLALGTVLYFVTDDDFEDFFKEQYLVSLVSAFGYAGSALLFAYSATTAPSLTVFTLVPVAALMFAYIQAASLEKSKIKKDALLLFLETFPSLEYDKESFKIIEQRLPEIFGSDFARVVSSTIPCGELEKTFDVPENWLYAYSCPLKTSTGTACVQLGSKKDPSILEKFFPWTRTRWNPREEELLEFQTLVELLSYSLSTKHYIKTILAETLKLETVLNASPEGVLVLNNDSKPVLANPAVRRMVGESVVPGDLKPPSREAAHLVQRVVDEPLDFEVLFTRPDGSSREIHISKTRVDNAGEVFTVVFFKDLTTERKVERLKFDFIATVSHELRTPLTPIKGYSSILLSKRHGLSDEKIDRMLETINVKADVLSTMVSELIAASQTDTTVDNRSFRLAQIEAGLSAVSDRIDFVYENNLVVSDPDKVLACLGYVVDNALKYSNARVLVDMQVEDSSLKVSVSDEGSGVPPEEWENIFKPFYRLEDPLLMTTGGVGMGLYAARKVALSLGGDLKVVSSNVFQLTLPLK